MTAPATPARKHRWKLWLAVVILAIILCILAWAAATRFFAYSSGERAGFVQKFSQKGWICKTWEGQLAMTTQPGVPPIMWDFTVRNDSIASAINALVGKRVALHYRQHVGVPTSCFGDTEYYVDGVSAAPY
jgi:ABC-type phosphate/phosphonate transport system permease subunit